ncbi:DUF1566 domain-containing protein [Leptospira yasudae]|uniref:Lcl C-terminal domain-containing protein n=1 Tax=Leptospira yasudae TaxID=2202201 RepID=UPI001090C3EF|nr:DUF1566 domain-containing protein [Leptospira yasudae]MBW0435585.1 DUF1566 domain-containing protein [Leptospira yasudae]TGM95290.1 DUF1566 domain-containing protein [Leptospira yasudae]
MRVSIFIFYYVFLLSCIKAPEKPDPPYNILRYLQNPNSSQSEQNHQNDSCTNGTSPAGSAPGAVFDTGQTGCWNGAGGLILCAGTGQDGEFNNVPNARTFSGPTPHCRYTSDYTTFDSLHGLTWKTCAQGQSGSDCLVGAPIPINWNDANAGLAGSCSSLNLLNGGIGYAGKTNWRIPTIRELASLIHYSNAPHIETANFPNTLSGTSYMTDTLFNPWAGAGIWNVTFSTAGLSTGVSPKGNPINLRCVSGNTLPATVLLDNGDGTITDSNTNLLWAKCTDGQTGLGCAGGALNALDWNQALNACNGMNFAGRTDWRLPNANELFSIVDHTTDSPTITGAIFPNTPSGSYWTSTTSENSKSNGNHIDFTSGPLFSSDKLTTPSFVRCVTNN